MSDIGGAPPQLIEPVAAPEAASAPAAPAPATSASPAAPAAPAPAPALVPHTETATLLDAGATPPAEAPADPGAAPADPAAAPADPAAAPVKEPPAPGETTPPATEPPAAATEPPVKFEDFVIPEGVTLDQDRVGKFTEVLTKADLDPQTRAQQLLDMHVDAMRSYADQTLQNQHSAFADTRKEWRNRVLADPQLGGAGHGTAMAAIARMRDLFVAPEHRAEFDEWQRITGSGDNPAPLRLLLNVARRFDEPGPPPSAPKPPPDIGRKQGSIKRADWYDNPASAANR